MNEIDFIYDNNDQWVEQTHEELNRRYASMLTRGVLPDYIDALFEEYNYSPPNY